MENKLTKLFEFQRFEKNKQLDKIIRDVQDKYPESSYLDETALSLVAGGKKSEDEFKKKDEEKI